MKVSVGVYQITNSVTNDFYVGSSNNIWRRICEHCSNLANNKHGNQHLQNAYNKYGKQAFEFKILLLCDIENKLYYEQVCLDGLKPIYNIAVCAQAARQGLHHTEKARAKLSVTLLGNTNALGHKCTDKARKIMRELKIGKTLTEEHKHKIGEAGKGNTYRLGTHQSEETKHKIGEAQKGKVISEETRERMIEAWKTRPRKGVHVCKLV